MSRRRWRAFLDGASRLLDLGGSTYRRPDFLDRTDAEALASDWQAVGDDLWRAIREYERQRDHK